MWVDRASAELRRLEFRYANVSPEEQEKAGGDVEFKRVHDGTWLISRWNIRMPVLEQSVRGRSADFGARRASPPCRCRVESSRSRAAVRTRCGRARRSSSAG